MANKIYVSDFSGYEILHNSSKRESIKLDGVEIGSGKPIVKFAPYRVFDEQRGQIVLKGYLILDKEKDKEKIAFLDSYPDKNRGYKETAQLPTNTNVMGSVVTGIAPPQGEVNLKALAQETKDKTIKQMNRYYELKQKLFNKNGEQKKDADEAELKEFDELVKELEAQ